VLVAIDQGCCCALGAIHQWHCVGIVLGQCCVNVLGCRCHCIVVGSWPGHVFRRRVMSVVAWLVAFISCCFVIHCGHSQVVHSITANDDQCYRLSFGCHVAVSDVAPDSNVKKCTWWRGSQCSPGHCLSWSSGIVA